MAPGLAGAFLCHSAHFVQCELITLASATREIRPKLGSQGTHTNRQGCPRPIPPVPGPEARVTTGFFRSSLKKGPTLVPGLRAACLLSGTVCASSVEFVEGLTGPALLCTAMVGSAYWGALITLESVAWDNGMCSRPMADGRVLPGELVLGPVVRHRLHGDLHHGRVVYDRHQALPVLAALRAPLAYHVCGRACLTPPELVLALVSALRGCPGNAALHVDLLRRDDPAAFFEALLSVVPAQRLALCNRAVDGGWQIVQYIETLNVPAEGAAEWPQVLHCLAAKERSRIACTGQAIVLPEVLLLVIARQAECGPTLTGEVVIAPSFTSQDLLGLSTIILRRRRISAGTGDPKTSAVWPALRRPEPLRLRTQRAWNSWRRARKRLPGFIARPPLIEAAVMPSAEKTASRRTGGQECAMGHWSAVWWQHWCREQRLLRRSWTKSFSGTQEKRDIGHVSLRQPAQTGFGRPLLKRGAGLGLTAIIREVTGTEAEVALNRFDPVANAVDVLQEAAGLHLAEMHVTDAIAETNVDGVAVGSQAKPALEVGRPQ